MAMQSICAYPYPERFGDKAKALHSQFPENLEDLVETKKIEIINIRRIK